MNETNQGGGVEQKRLQDRNLKDSNIQEAGRRLRLRRNKDRRKTKRVFWGAGWGGYENLQKRVWPTTPVMPKDRTEIFVKIISAERSR